jgi:hypothetical protein
MQLAAFRHTLDRLYVTVFGVQPEHQAGKDRFPIDQNRARATLTQLAAMLGSGQGKIFAQNFEQVLCGANATSANSPLRVNEM